jgi:hypothetical protein
LAVAPCWAKPYEERREVQKHGYIFEQWVRAQFFEGYELKSYTQLWDVPAENNRNYGGIPVQIKAVKYGQPVDLSDALRQFDIGQEFLLIVGYWKQDGERKKLVNVVAVRVTPEKWKALWHPLTRNDVAKLDAIVKNRELSPLEARKEAREFKKQQQFRDAMFTLNPKIDTKTQRRLQCSLRFGVVFEQLAPTAGRQAQERPSLFGISVPEAFVSPPRVRRKESAQSTLEAPAAGR